MNSSRYSSLAVALLVLAAAAVAPVAAVTVSGSDVPDAVEVGETQDVSFAMEELYTNYDRWTLEGHTELVDVTWSVTTYDVGGTQLDQTQYNSQNFSHAIDKDADVAEVEVRLQGTTPEVGNWTYDPAEEVILASFEESQEGGASNAIETYDARPHTQDSQSARDAIDSAAEAIDDADVNTDEAESILDNAISAYENGNFENAESLADRARDEAESAQQSSQQRNTLLMVGAGIVVLLLVVGGVYWYLSQRDTYDKLG